MSNHNSVKWATEEGQTYSTSLSEFANRHNLTNDEFIRGSSGRSHHAGGGNVQSVGTMPTWAQGQQATGDDDAQGLNTGGMVLGAPGEMPQFPVAADQELQPFKDGGNVTFEWGGGSNNKRVRRADGGSINTSKFTNFLNSLNSK